MGLGQVPNAMGLGKLQWEKRKKKKDVAVKKNRSKKSRIAKQNYIKNGVPWQWCEIQFAECSN